MLGHVVLASRDDLERTLVSSLEHEGLPIGKDRIDELIEQTGPLLEARRAGVDIAESSTESRSLCRSRAVEPSLDRELLAVHQNLDE